MAGLNELMCLVHKIDKEKKHEKKFELMLELQKKLNEFLENKNIGEKDKIIAKVLIGYKADEWDIRKHESLAFGLFEEEINEFEELAKKHGINAEKFFYRKGILNAKKQD